MKRRSSIALAGLLLSTVSELLAQEGTWTISGSAGMSFLRMDAVNATLERTVTFWNDVEFIPVGPFPKFSTSPVMGGRVEYRYDRDMAVSLASTISFASVENNYDDGTVRLEMDRSVGSVDMMLGLSYFFPLGQEWEIQAFVDAGAVIAWAKATTFNARVEKSGPDFVTTVYYDTKASYRKVKAIASFGSTISWMLDPIVLRIGSAYRFANIGQMQGTIERLQRSIEELSATKFDFSRVSVTVEAGVRFE